MAIIHSRLLQQSTREKDNQRRLLRECADGLHRRRMCEGKLSLLPFDASLDVSSDGPPKGRHSSAGEHSMAVRSSLSGKSLAYAPHCTPLKQFTERFEVLDTGSPKRKAICLSLQPNDIARNL